MKWYWLLSNENAVPDPFIADWHEFHGVDESALWMGRPVTDWSPVAQLGAKKPRNDGDPDDALQNSLGLPIFSPRLVDAIQAAGLRGLQLLPVHITRPSGGVISGFQVANIVERRAALDLERATFSSYPQDYFLAERRGRVASLLKPALLRSALEGCDFMRLDEYVTPMFASRRFVELFEGGRYTGYAFQEVPVR